MRPLEDPLLNRTELTMVKVLSGLFLEQSLLAAPGPLAWGWWPSGPLAQGGALACLCLLGGHAAARPSPQLPGGGR